MIDEVTTPDYWSDYPTGKMLYASRGTLSCASATLRRHHEMRAEVTHTSAGLLVEIGGDSRVLANDQTIDGLFESRAPWTLVSDWFNDGRSTSVSDDDEVLAPIGHQEVWAAGVTYSRSRAARVAESQQADANTFYDLVYDAERPELFFKSTAHRVVGHRSHVRLRSDSAWNVPEPELTLAVSAHGEIFGYTVGNDMSSRSIEGENPLYLPQAKIYSGSASIGPRLVVSDEAPSPATEIHMAVHRAGHPIFEGTTTISRMRRTFASLVEWLYRDNDFPAGVYLMTGTGIVPEDDFTLAGGDEIRITIGGIGTLVNHVAC